jgi:hypothetical protein
VVPEQAGGQQRFLARALASADVQEEPDQEGPPATSSTAISARLLSAWRTPNTTRNMPTADRTAPNASNGRVGSAGSGSSTRRLSRTISATTAA